MTQTSQKESILNNSFKFIDNDDEKEHSLKTETLGSKTIVKIVDEFKTSSSSNEVLKTSNNNTLNKPSRENSKIKIRKSSKSKQTNLDYILSLIGSFGLYQKLQFILVGFLAVVPSMVAYSYVFVAATPKFTCSLATGNQLYEVKNFTNNFDKELVNPIDNRYYRIENINLVLDVDKVSKNESIFDNSCQMSVPGINQLSPGSSASLKNNNLVLRCQEWLYDESVYGPTIATEWNLICKKSYLKAVTQNAYIIGTACAILSGIMSDKIGRKTTMMLMITLMAIVLNVTQLLMHHSILNTTQKFTIFTVSRFLQGFAQTMYAVSFVLLMEITGPQHRVLAGNIMAYSFAIGQIVLVLLAYYLRDWRKIMWSLAIYVMPFFTYYWLVPESPRWLLNRNKVYDAKNVLKKISILNNTYNYYMASITKYIRRNRVRKQSIYMDNYLKNAETSVYIHTLLQEEANKFFKTRKTQQNYTTTLIGITKSKVLLKRCFILFYIWSIILMVYLGMGMGMSNVMDKIINPYLIFFIQACCEFLGIVTCHLVLNRYGRKIPLTVFMFISATVIFLIPVFYVKHPIVSCVFYLIAKYAISAAQLTCMIFTSELYPTPMRGTGVGLSACISRLGGVWAPQINVLSSTLGFYVPYMVFSSFSLIAAFVSFFLPETLNKSLPENIIEAEKMDRPDSISSAESSPKKQNK